MLTRFLKPTPHTLGTRIGWFNLKLRKLSRQSTLRTSSALRVFFVKPDLKEKAIFPVTINIEFIKFFFSQNNPSLRYLHKFFFFNNFFLLKQFSSFLFFFSPSYMPFQRNFFFSTQFPLLSASKMIFFYLNNLFLVQNWIHFFHAVAKNVNTRRDSFIKTPSFYLPHLPWQNNFLRHSQNLQSLTVFSRDSSEINHFKHLRVNFFLNHLFIRKSLYWAFFTKYKNKSKLFKNVVHFNKPNIPFQSYKIFGTFLLFLDDLNFNRLKRTTAGIFFIRPSDYVHSQLTKITRYTLESPSGFSLFKKILNKKNFKFFLKKTLPSDAKMSQLALSKLYNQNDQWVESSFCFAKQKLSCTKISNRKKKQSFLHKAFFKSLNFRIKPLRLTGSHKFSKTKKLLKKKKKKIHKIFNRADKNFTLNKVFNPRIKNIPLKFRPSLANSTFKKYELSTNARSSLINFNFINYFFSVSKPEFLLVLSSSPIFFRYFFYKTNNFSKRLFFTFSNFFLEKISNLTTNSFFYSNFSERNLKNTNIVPNSSFKFFLKKYLIKTFTYNRFSSATASWHYLTIVRFLEFCSGKKVYINFFTFITKLLSPIENARCELWSQRLKSFKKAFGAKLFVTESLQIIYTALKLKDPYFLSNWLLGMFYKISFWKLKLVIRYLHHVLRYLFSPYLKEIALRGLKVQIKGKVSVAGNARTRTFAYRIGRTSHAKFDNKVLYNLNLIRTFTGVIGFKTWLVF